MGRLRRHPGGLRPGSGRRGCGLRCADVGKLFTARALQRAHKVPGQGACWHAGMTPSAQQLSVALLAAAPPSAGSESHALVAGTPGTWVVQLRCRLWRLMQGQQGGGASCGAGGTGCDLGLLTSLQSPVWPCLGPVSAAALPTFDNRQRPSTAGHDEACTKRLAQPPAAKTAPGP